MSDAKLLPFLVAKHIANLKTQDPIAHSEHDNLLVDFGWEVQEGDDRIGEVVKDFIRADIDELSEVAMYLIWSETFSAECTKKGIIEVFQGIYKSMEFPEWEEIYSDVLEQIFEGVYYAAEEVYSEYKENEYAEEDDEDENEEEL